MKALLAKQLEGKVFANGPGERGSIPGWVILKTQKVVLDASLLNTEHYKIQIKGKVEQSRERCSTLPLHLNVVVIEKSRGGQTFSLEGHITRLWIIKEPHLLKSKNCFFFFFFFFIEAPVGHTEPYSGQHVAYRLQFAHPCSRGFLYYQSESLLLEFEFIWYSHDVAEVWWYYKILVEYFQLVIKMF